jgi:hypothetical protein
MVSVLWGTVALLLAALLHRCLSMEQCFDCSTALGSLSGPCCAPLLPIHTAATTF